MSPSVNGRFLTLLVVLGLTAAGLAYLVSTRSTPPVSVPEERTWTVDSVRLEPGTFTPELSLLGTVQSSGLARITSRITADVLVTPLLGGTRVSKGTILMELDPTDAGAALRQREADVSELKAVIAEEKLRHRFDEDAMARENTLLELAQKSLARQKQLAKSNVSSQERVEAAEIALEQQQLSMNARQLSFSNHANRMIQFEARLTRAQALLEVARQDFSQTTLKAPFDGWITAVYPMPGSRVRLGDPLIELLADNTLEVAAQIPNSAVARLREALAQGQSVAAQTHLYGQTATLKLVRMAAKANDKTAGLDAYFAPDEANKLTLGKSLSIKISLPPLSDVYSLPVIALYGDETVYRIEGERLAPLTIQKLGRFQDAQGQDRIIFSSPDLKAGDEIILTQLPNAVSGLKVRRRS
ncbi:MAG: HlyD family efflux transporter periplasmic adaptor subunit [Hahellaceae bacterium]|nr:HlyD family efflux transporter periplasmic adaptor subunit [Hahellaceae bacterium]